jgi:hypothetical protein
MRCPVCGYPNYEKASTCFSCNAEIEDSTPPKPKPDILQEPGIQNKKSLLRKLAIERWKTWLLASVFALISSILTWESAFIRDPITMIPIQTLSVNLFDLLMTDSIIVVSLSLIYVIGLILSMIIPRLIILPVSALILLLFAMPPYLQSLLPGSETGLGFGYFLALLSSTIVATFAIKDFDLRFTKGHGKDQSPSEGQEPNAVNRLWNWLDWGGGRP